MIEVKYPQTITNYASNSNVHVLRCLPELLPLAVAVARWDLVEEVHDSLHRVSSRRQYPWDLLQHYAADLCISHPGNIDKNWPRIPADPAQKEHRRRVVMHAGAAV
jgi:hypothetical protein